MGWLVEGQKGGRTVYYAVYRDLQGKQRSAGAYSSKREADDAWQDAEADLRAGRRVGDPKLGRQRFRSYVLETWFPNHLIEETTREKYTYHLNNR